MSTPIDAMRERFLQSGDNADLPIVDAHHHFWDLQRNYHPWLRDLPRIPFRYGDYESICRDFLPEDYFALAAPHRVVKTVMMEGEWDARDPLGEARWATTLNAHCGFPNATAGQVWLDRDDVAHVLREYQSTPIVRSVRHKPTAVPRSDHTATFAAPGSMRCDRWRAGYALLEASGLMFELQTPWWHFIEAVELARDFPGVTIIGTSATRAGILERVPTYIGQMRSFAPTDSLMRLRLSTGRMRDSSKMPDDTRLLFGLAQAGNEPKIVHGAYLSAPSS